MMGDKSCDAEERCLRWFPKNKDEDEDGTGGMREREAVGRELFLFPRLSVTLAGTMRWEWGERRRY